MSEGARDILEGFIEDLAIEADKNEQSIKLAQQIIGHPASLPSVNPELLQGDITRLELKNRDLDIARSALITLIEGREVVPPASVIEQVEELVGRSDDVSIGMSTDNTPMAIKTGRLRGQNQPAPDARPGKTTTRKSREERRLIHGEAKVKLVAEIDQILRNTPGLPEYPSYGKYKNIHEMLADKRIERPNVIDLTPANVVRAVYLYTIGFTMGEVSTYFCLGDPSSLGTVFFKKYLGELKSFPHYGKQSKGAAQLRTDGHPGLSGTIIEFPAEAFVLPINPYKK